LDEDIILKAAKETGAIVTAEEHNVLGGLGGAVAEFLAENNPVVSSELSPKVRTGRYLAYATGIYVVLFAGLVVLGFFTRQETMVRDKNHYPVQVTLCYPAIRDTSDRLIQWSILGAVLIFVPARLERDKEKSEVVG